MHRNFRWKVEQVSPGNARITIIRDGGDRVILLSGAKGTALLNALSSAGKLGVELGT
jgi:hypothetical protein